MKTWLRNKIHGFLYPQDSMAQLSVAVTASGGVNMDDSLRFNVLVGSGGVVLQLQKYDRKSDRNNNSTHIIADGEPIAERIGQIVSMEMLKY